MTTIKQTATLRRWLRKLKDEQAKALIAARVLRAATDFWAMCRRSEMGLPRLFKQRGPAVVILLCGGDKSSQERDIRSAKQLALNWIDDDG